MQLQEFWGIVGRAKMCGTAADRPKALQEVLEEGYGKEQIESFNGVFGELASAADESEQVAAADVLMNDNLIKGMDGKDYCSRDGRRYFISWLISEGEDAYNNAMADGVGFAKAHGKGAFCLESFAYAPHKALKSKSAQ